MKECEGSDPKVRNKFILAYVIHPELPRHAFFIFSTMHDTSIDQLFIPPNIFIHTYEEKILSSAVETTSLREVPSAKDSEMRKMSKVIPDRLQVIYLYSLKSLRSESSDASTC